MADIWYMRFVCWITKATHSHSEYVTLLLVHDKNGKREKPQYYVLRTLTVMFSLSVFLSPFTGGRVATNPLLVQAILPNVYVIPWKNALF